MTARQRPGLAIVGVTACLALLLGARRVAAQEAYRQTVVVTAATTPVELGSVTRSMTVITREMIAALPARTVADVLRLAASVDVRARGFRGVQTDFAVRGANFGQVLVLVDGVRLNDAQSGHHNGDIPVPLDAVERIEVLYGPGSSLHGADAFGGTVNVITRVTASPSLTIEGGSFSLAGGSGQAGFASGPVSGLVSASGSRSSGFMYDRDFATAMTRVRATVATGTNVSVSFLRNAFGANNFYGGNAPSREWTNQTLAAVDHRFGTMRGWALTADASYRTHGDRFVFNQTRPELSDNRHRTHATIASVTAGRTTVRGATVALGVEGGADWVRSTNLGDHQTSRASVFGEYRQPLGTRVQLDASLRTDRYDEFGTAWSPSAGVSWWPRAPVRLRASAGRAFRVPTFTERYYSDPANLARAEVGPETAWAGEGGADVFLPRDWVVQATVFGRADRDVIDWLRPSTAVRWQTYNVRRVATRGAEFGVRKAFAGGAFLHADYTGITLDPSAVDQLSKYVLDFAPRSLTAVAVLPLPSGFSLAPRFEYRMRRRPLPLAAGGVAVGAFDYALVDVRVSRRFGRLYEVNVEGTNLLNRRYQEVAGVVMPGSALSVSLAVRAR